MIKNVGVWRRAACLTILGLGLLATETRAAFVGSFGVNTNLPAIAPSSGLAGATTFSIASMNSNGNTTGGFTGMPASTAFTGSTFAMDNTLGFTFTNATYGTFQQTAAAVMTSVGMVKGVMTSEAFYIVGMFSGGMIGGSTPASFTVSFTQNGGPGTSISASGTLDISPQAGSVPEPASITLLSIGLVAAIGRAYRFRHNVA